MHECEAKLCSCKLWPETEFALVHLSLEEIVVFVHCKVLWPRSFSSWWLSRVLGSAHLLVSHVLRAVHWKGEIVTTEQVQLGIGVNV